MKQTVYHGSTEQVRHPEIRESDRLLDYGKGFYTTTSLEQAMKRAVLKKNRE